MVDGQIQVRVTHVEHTWRFRYHLTEAESVSLCTFSDCVCCGVCTVHDLRVACSYLRRVVAVLNVHARMGAGRQHSGQQRGDLLVLPC